MGNSHTQAGARRLGLAVACSLLAVSVMAVTPAFAAYRQTYQFVASHSATAGGSGIQPMGIAIGPDSSVYLAGNSDYAAKLDSDWGLLTLPGFGNNHIWDPSSVTPLDQVRGVALDGTSLWVLDYSNGAAKFTDAGYFSSIVCMSAYTPLSNPTAISVDASGSVYIADNGGASLYGFRVTKFTPAGVFTGIEFGFGPNPLLSAQAVAVGPDFTVYVADSIAQKIWRYRPGDASRSNYVYVGFWQNHAYDNPVGLACAADGSIFVLDDDSKSVTKLASDGTVLAHWGSYGDGAGQFYNPRGIAIGPNGHVYATDRDKQTVLEFEPLDLGPSTQAAGTVTVKKGKTASFKYRIYDDFSNSVNVTIKIYKGRSLKKTISCGRVSQGSWHIKTWKDTLAKGTYTWKVYASDLAGHAQRNVASKTFKVK